MSTREGYAAALGAGLGMTFGMLFGAIAAGSTWTQGLATLGAGVLGLYIIARMIIEDGRLERELLHGGQPDDEEPERAPAMFRDRYDTGYRDGYDDAVESLQFANLPQRPRKGKHKRKAAAIFLYPRNTCTGRTIRIAGAAHCDGTPARRVTLWGRRPPP